MTSIHRPLHSSVQTRSRHAALAKKAEAGLGEGHASPQSDTCTCMACTIMYCRKYDVSFTSSKRVNYTSLSFPEDQFPCKTLDSIVHTVTCFDVGIIMYCED